MLFHTAVGVCSLSGGVPYWHVILTNGNSLVVNELIAYGEQRGEDFGAFRGVGHLFKLKTPTGVEQLLSTSLGRNCSGEAAEVVITSKNSACHLCENEMHQHTGEAVSQFCLCHEAIYCALLKLGRLFLGISCMFVSPDLSIQVPCLGAAWYFLYEETLENTFLAARSNKQCCSQQLLFV